jgi:hypothetical protein
MLDRAIHAEQLLSLDLQVELFKIYSSQQMCMRTNFSDRSDAPGQLDPLAVDLKFINLDVLIHKEIIGLYLGY